MTTIIIPAHNEEKTIYTCLSPLLNYIEQDLLKVIVVCNGCIDNTANVVKKLSSKITCLETEISSKTYALNLGDKISNSFPRLYLDADISLSPDAIMAMHATLKNNWLATSVEPRMDTSQSSWFVKAFYDIWLMLPYCKSGMIGSGVYALSEEGRARFDQFPDIISDDGYVRCLFKEEERTMTKEHYAIVKAPKDLVSLIKIKTRSRLGRYQLHDNFPHLLPNEEKNYQAAFRSFLFDFKLWPKVFVYLTINFISRIRARRQYLTKQLKWERDDSNRI